VRPAAWQPKVSSNLSGKLIHMKSIREVTARGSGHWYHAYDVELATWTTTWADSGGTRTRTLLKYELRINDARVPGPRYFSTDEERQAFIGRSFSDLTLRDLNPPQRGTVAHPLAELVGQYLVAVVFVADYFELDWGNRSLDIYARARVKDATGWTEHSAPEYPIVSPSWPVWSWPGWTSCSTAVSSLPPRAALSWSSPSAATPRCRKQPNAGMQPGMPENRPSIRTTVRSCGSTITAVPAACR
jgi:hypothetical protein